MRDVHSIAAAVRAANARNVARAGRQLPIRKILAATTGIAGFVMAMAVERSLWFALPAAALLIAALALQARR